MSSTGLHTCKHSIYDPHDVTRSCVLELGHSGPHRSEVVVATKCGICHETNGEHLLSCPTRWS